MSGPESSSEPDARGGAPQMGRRSIEAGIVFASQIAALGLTFATGVLAARIFSVEERGEYGMFMTLTSFVFVFTAFGVPEALVYFHRQGQADRGRIATSILLGALLSLALAIPASLLLAPELAARYFPSGGVALVKLSFVAGVATVLLRNSTAFLQARHQFIRSGACSLLLPLFFFTALIWVWYADLDLLEMGEFYAMAAVIAGFAAFQPLVSSLGTRNVDRSYLSRLSRFSLKSYAQAIVNQLNYRIDMFIVASLMTNLADVAYYHVAAGLAGLIWVIPDSYGQAIYPRMAASESERERSFEAIFGLRAIAVTVGLGVAGVAVAASWLVPLLFGPSYAASVPLLLLLLPGVFAMALSKILTRYFASQNRHQLNTLFILAGVAVGICANFLLIPRIGAAGAAIASSLAYITMALGLTVAFLRRAELRSSDLQHFPAREFKDGMHVIARVRTRLGGA